MKKLLLSIFFTMTLPYSLIYAETPKHPKSAKKSDTNKTMTNDEFMKEFAKLDQELAEAKKTGKKLDEINKLLGVDGKKK